MRLNTDLKNNVSVAAQQGIYFNQHPNKAQQTQNMNAATGCNANANSNGSQQPHGPQSNNNSQREF